MTGQPSRTSRRIRRLAALSIFIGLAAPVSVFADESPTPPPGDIAPDGLATNLAGDTAGDIVPIEPVRVLDTRPGQSTIDGRAEIGAALAADDTLTVEIAGRAGVPSDAAAAVINITAINPERRGFATIHPCGERPLASSLNYNGAGVVVGNEIAAKLSDTGSLCIYTSATTHFTADLVGYVPAGAATNSLEPARLLDTRPGATTVDGIAAGAGPIGAGEEVEIEVAGRGGVPTDGAAAAIINVTAINPDGRGFVTIHPCDDRPLASSLNYASAGVVAGNEVIAKLSDTGTICAYSSARTNLTMDVVGEFPADATYTPLDPVRVLETRPGENTVDGLEAGQGAIPAGEEIEFDVAGRGNVPLDAVAAVVNVTAINPAARGFVTVHPCGERPLASSLNYSGAGAVVGNEIIAKLSDTGTLCAYSSATTHLAADLVGYVPADSAPEPDPDPDPKPGEVGTLTNPRRDAGWHAEPEHVEFTSDGMSHDVEFVEYDADGEPTGRSLPAGTTLVRTASTFDATLTADGVLRVDGSTTIGSELIGVSIPGEDELVTLWVTSARLADDVVALDRSSIVMPPVERSTVDSFAPFTADEVMARFAPDATPSRVAIIVRGDAPDVGTTIAAGNVAGTVVESGGVPAISRDGLTLLTLEIGAITDVYDDIAVDVDYADLFADGLYDPNVDAFASDGSGTDGFDDNSAAPRLDSFLDRCALDGTLGLGELKASGDLTLDPRGDFVFLASNGSITGFEMTVGLSITLTAGLSGKAVLSAKVPFECELLDLGDTPPLPLPPQIRAFISIFNTASIVVAGEVDANAGAEANFNASCTATVDVGMTVGYNGGVTVQNASQQPTSGCTADYGVQGLTLIGDLGPSVEGEAKIGLFLKGENKVRPGGDIAEFINVLATALQVTDNDELGVFAPVEVYIGPRLDLVFELPGNVFADQGHKTSLALKGVATGGFNKDMIEDPLEAIFGFHIDVPLPVFEFTTEAFTIIETPSDAQLSARLDGEVKGTDTVIEVPVDSTLVVEIGLPTSSGLVSFTPPSSVSAYDREGPSASYTTDLTFTTSGTSAVATLDMDKNTCDEKFNTIRDLQMLGAMEYSGTPAIPVHLGNIQVTCQDVAGFRSPDENREERPGSRTLRINSDSEGEAMILAQNGYDGASWRSAGSNLPPSPIELTVDPLSGVLGDDLVLEITLDCGSDDDSEGQSVFDLTVGDEQRDAELTIEWSCKPAWITAEPGQVQPGQTIQINSLGPDPDQWVAVGSGVSTLNWTADPMPEGEYTRILFVNDPRSVACNQKRKKETRFVSFTTEARDASKSVAIDLPELVGRPCSRGGRPLGGPPGPYSCLACGDPHLVSFDGVSYDAQVLGDYLYAQDPSRDLRLVGRHKSVLDDPAASFGATVVEAFAFELGDTLVEFYATPTGRDVLVDGQPVTLAIGQSSVVGDQITLTELGASMELFAPDINLEIAWDDAFDGMLDVNVGLGISDALDLTGLLGSNNGDPSDDLTLSSGGTITIEEARAHADAFYEFTQSWRYDVEADSPLRRPSATFHAPNPERPDPADLDPYRIAVLDELAGLDAVCGGTLTSDDYLVEQLALELAIGNDLDNVLELACAFDIAGTVTVDVPTTDVIAAAGALVTVDAVGFQACVDVADAAGRYSCTLVPALAEIGDGSSISYPIDADVDVRPNGSNTVGATTVAILDAAPAFTTTTRLVDVDAELTDGSVPVIDLSGTITEFGEPLTQATVFEVEFLDGSNVPLSEQTLRIDPDGAGAYRELMVAPIGTDHLDVTWRLVGEPLEPTTTLTPLLLGTNTFTFDPDFSPARVALSGAASVNGEVPNALRIAIDATVAGTATSFDRFAYPDPSTGIYDTEIALPLGTTSATFDVSPDGTSLTPVTTTVDAPDPGVTSIALDVVYDVAMLSISGDASQNGAAVTEAFDLVVTGLGTGGVAFESSTQVQPTPSGGYAVDVVLIDGMESATITAEIGPDAPFPTVTANDLLVGTNTVDFDIAADHPVLVLTGTVTAGPVPDPGPMWITVDTPSSTDLPVAERVTVDDNGDFVARLALAPGTTTATVTAKAGFGEPDWTIVPVDTLVDGDNPLTIDAGYEATAVSISGRITDRGDAPELVQIWVRGIDVHGETTQTRTPFVFPDDDGDYDTVQLLDPDTVAVSVGTLQSPISVGRHTELFTGLDRNTLGAITFDRDFDPPVLAVSGLFTTDDGPLTGVGTLEADVEYVALDGDTAYTTLGEPLYMSVIDGRYAVSMELPETAQNAALIARVGPDPAAYPAATINPVLAGVNSFDLSADFDAPVDVDLSATLTGDGQPFTHSTSLKYRAYDGRGIRNVDLTTLSITPDGSGQWAGALQLPNETRRLEVAWPLTSGPEYVSFDVNPGDNSAQLTAAVPAVTLDIDGTLLDNGAPFVGDATIELQLRTTRTSSVIDTLDVDVTTDASGNFSIDTDVEPRVGYVFIERDGNYSPQGFTLVPGSNVLQPVFNDITYGTQTIQVNGTASIGGAPWPNELTFRVRSARDNDSYTVVPDPITGEFTITHVAGGAIDQFELREFDIGYQSGWFPMAPDGTTEVDIDVELPGRLVQVSGAVTVDGSAPTSAWVHAVDVAGESSSSVWVEPDPTTGAYDADLRFLNAPDEVFVGIRQSDFHDDVLFEASPRTLTGGVTSFDTVDFSVDTRQFTVAGTIIENDAPRTLPFDVVVEWSDADAVEPATWSSYETATPDGNGTYSLVVDAPDSATTAVVTAEVGATTAVQQRTIDPIADGNTAVGISTDHDSVTLDVSGVVLNGDEAPFFSVPVTIEARGIGGDLVSTIETHADADGDTGEYSLVATLPAEATEVTLSGTAHDWAWWRNEHPGLEFESDPFTLDPSGTSTMVFDMRATGLFQRGEVITTDGHARENESFAVTVKAYDDGILVDTWFDQVSTFDDGLFQYFDFYAPGVDEVVFEMDASGADPVTFSNIVAEDIGLAEFNVFTDPMKLLTIQGTMTLDGSTPGAGRIDEFGVSFLAVVDTPDGPQTTRVFSDYPDFDYVDGQGNGSYTMLAPPEADFAEVDMRFLSSSFEGHVRQWDIRGLDEPIVLDIDIAQQDDVVEVAGMALVAGDPGVGPCPNDDTPFVFETTIWGYAGDPADGATPPATALATYLVVPNQWPLQTLDGQVENWRRSAPVPDGITHVRVDYSTTGVDIGQDAALVSTGDPVAFPGGALDLRGDITAVCTQ